LSRPPNSTGLDPEYLRECLDVLSADPPVLRWRIRPPKHFLGDDKSVKAQMQQWRKTFAGQTIRPQGDGRLRVNFRVGRERRTLDARAIVAEIGVTPAGTVQGLLTTTPNDRLAATRRLAGAGPLAAVLQEAMDATGRSMDDLTVMRGPTDPYRLDTPAKHRDGQWFAEQVARFVDPTKRIHPRGVFYACVSAGDVIKPDGEPFENNAEDEAFMGAVSKAARWLGYVPFERLVDNKNDGPIVRKAPSSDDPTAHVWPDDLAIEESVCDCGRTLSPLDADALGVSAGLADFEPRQPYRLVFFGEKTSLEDVLAPLAVEFSADLYLMSGQISDTLLHSMARDAVADGRPLVVLTFSDFDPAGYWDMPTSIGRKLQALRDLLFPALEFTVAHAALGPEQVHGLNLPSSPLKEGEKRAAKWLELYGSEQTEIDALATLRPDELERIARDAVAPYFDAGLADRVRTAHAEWRERANAGIAAQGDEGRLAGLKERADSALDELRAVNTELADMAGEVVVPDAPELPDPDMAALEEAQAGARDAVLIDSAMDYAEAVDRLKSHSELVARRGERVRR
jgi:hypothetical protein